MRVLVTGGAGYLGSTLSARLLQAGLHVRVIDSLLHSGKSLLPVWAHPNFDYHFGDIRDAAAIQSALSDVDAVVHLAAIVGDPACAREPEVTRAVNLDAGKSLLEASQKAGVERFIFASTCSNYGKSEDPDRLMTEDDELRPVSLYAETKVEMERAVLQSVGDGAWAPTAVRLSTLFGVSPRMRFDLTVNDFTYQLATRKRLEIFGERFWRPYVHVADAAAAIQLVLESPAEQVAGEVFNVGANNQNYQKQQIAELIQPLVPEATIEYVHRDEDPRDYRVAFDKIHDRLGFETSRSVADGVREVFALVNGGVIDDFSAAEYHN